MVEYGVLECVLKVGEVSATTLQLWNTAAGESYDCAATE